MVSSLLAFIATTDPVHFIMDSVARTHASVQSEQIVAKMTITEKGKPRTITYTLARELPGKYAITVNDPTEVTPSRRWIFGAGQVVLFEPATEKYVVRNTDLQRNIGEVIEEELPNVDQFAKLLLMETGMSEWAKVTMQVPQWKLDSKKPVISFEEPNLAGRMVIDPKARRITELMTRVADVKTVYTITYQQLPAPTPFKLGENAYQVAMLSDPNNLPKMDAATKSFVSDVLRQYEPPRNIALNVSDTNGESTIYYSRKGIYQKDKVATFEYNGQSVKMKLANGTSYAGDAKKEQLLAATEAAGTRVDPMLRDLILGINPVSRILESADSAKLAGSTRLDGEACTLLKAKNAEVVMTFYVRNSDKFIKKIETTLPSNPGYKGVRSFKKIKEVSTLPRVETSSQALPLSRLIN